MFLQFKRTTIRDHSVTISLNSNILTKADCGLYNAAGKIQKKLSINTANDKGSFISLQQDTPYVIKCDIIDDGQVIASTKPYSFTLKSRNTSSMMFIVVIMIVLVLLIAIVFAFYKYLLLLPFYRVDIRPEKTPLLN